MQRRARKKSWGRTGLYAGIAVALIASGIGVAANASEGSEDSGNSIAEGSPPKGTSGNRVLADTPPTDQELLDECGNADVCTYTVKSTLRYPGPEHVVGDKVINCEPETITRQITWTDTTTASTNINLSIGVGSALQEVINASFNASLGLNFEDSHTTSQTFNETLRPFSKAEIVRATPMMATVGDWELHFPSRFRGHFIWFDKDVLIETEDPSGSGLLVFRQRALTQAEINASCEDFANIVAPEPFEEEKVLISPEDNDTKPEGGGKIEPGDEAATS